MSKKSDLKKSRRLSAVALRWILSILLLLILGGIAAGFYVANDYLGATAKEISDIQTKADSADLELQNLRTLKDKIAEEQKTIDKADRFVAESMMYQYQNQVIEDLQQYADAAGVQIDGFTFINESPGTPGGATGAPAATTPQPNAATPAPSVNEQTPNVGGPNAPGAQNGSTAAPSSTKITVNVKQNVSYRSLLKLVDLIEKNLPKIQITALSLARNGNGADAVTTQALNIEVYIR